MNLAELIKKLFLYLLGIPTFFLGVLFLVYGLLMQDLNAFIASIFYILFAGVILPTKNNKIKKALEGITKKLPIVFPILLIISAMYFTIQVGAEEGAKMEEQQNNNEDLKSVEKNNLDNCILECNNDSDCDDNNPLTRDVCDTKNCSRKCVNEIKEIVIITFGNNVTVRGMNFYSNIEEVGEEISYLSKYGEIKELTAKQGNKIYKITLSVNAVDEENPGFFKSRLELMDEEGNIYSEVCPIDSYLLKTCQQKKQIKSVAPFLEGQKIEGTIFFEVPKETKKVSLIYKFSTYDNPKAIQFVEIS